MARTLVSVSLGIVVGVALATGGVIASHGGMHCDGGTCNGNDNDNWIIASENYDDISAMGGKDAVEARAHGDFVGGNAGGDLMKGQGGDDGVHGNDAWDAYLRRGARMHAARMLHPRALMVGVAIGVMAGAAGFALAQDSSSGGASAPPKASNSAEPVISIGRQGSTVRHTVRPLWN